MAYKVVSPVDNMRDNYGPRDGLEGPFNFSGRVLYYDPIYGKYWDPRTDFYVPNEEMSEISISAYTVLAKSTGYKNGI